MTVGRTVRKKAGKFVVEGRYTKDEVDKEFSKIGKVTGNVYWQKPLPFNLPPLRISGNPVYAGKVFPVTQKIILTGFHWFPVTF